MHTNPNFALDLASLHRRAYEFSQEFSWHKVLTDAYELHPAVEQALRVLPADDPAATAAILEKIALEWPHVATTEPSRLAYTRNADDGVRDRQMVTPIGRYLTRVLGGALPDHVIRGIVTDYAATDRGDEFVLWEGPEAMVRAVQEGPRSCMQGEWGRHPYEVYTAEHGWKIAVQIVGGTIHARCLVNGDPDVGGIFVRSYERAAGYSPRSEALDNWLESKGYRQAFGWDGCDIARIPFDGSFLCPYIDGDAQAVDDHGDYLRITVDGEFDASNTDGVCGRVGRECDNCGEYADEDDGTYLGVYGDGGWYGACCGDSVRHVRGRGRRFYEVHEDNAVCVGDSWYDVDYLDDCGIVLLDDGDYVHEDEAILCEIRDAYYLKDDCVRVEDGDRWVHADEAWECAESGNWYSNDEEWVLVDGETVHPDNVPEDADEDEEDAAEGAEPAAPVCEHTLPLFPEFVGPLIPPNVLYARNLEALLASKQPPYIDPRRIAWPFPIAPTPAATESA